MEKIQIVGCTETVDNWGREERYTESETLALLLDHEAWSDDQIFWGPNNERYFIDDLIGKTVICNHEVFPVREG